MMKWLITLGSGAVFAAEADSGNKDLGEQSMGQDAAPSQQDQDGQVVGVVVGVDGFLGRGKSFWRYYEPKKCRKIFV